MAVDSLEEDLQRRTQISGGRPRNPDVPTSTEGEGDVVFGGSDSADPDDNPLLGISGLGESFGEYSTEEMWADVLTYILGSLQSVGDDLGFSKQAMHNFFQQNVSSVLLDAQAWLSEIRQDEQAFGISLLNPSSPTGFTRLADRVWQMFGQRAPFALPPMDSIRSSVRRVGGGGVRTSLTPEEIRNQFDLDELAHAATTLWQAWLLEDPDNARDMAEAYVEAIVASKAEKKIDFTEFIRKRAKETARWPSIYRNKPEGISEEAYLQRYYQSAQQLMRPQNAAAVAIGGAQFGADAQSFAGRLRRTDESTSSAPFMQDLQARLEDLNGVFKS